MPRPLLAKVAFASATLYAITSTVEMTLPAHLSSTDVAWLVKPWLGAYIHHFPPSSISSAGLHVGSAGLLLIVVAFYLDHCVVDQPLWAIVGGWAPMLSGLALLQMQLAFGAWWVSVDLNNAGFALGGCEFFVGVVVVAGSWLAEPELFNPMLSRMWVAAIITGILVLYLVLFAVNAPVTVITLVVVITFVAGDIASSGTTARKVRRSDRPSDDTTLANT